MHTETEKAYLAGLVDGEGHIAINVRSGVWRGHQVMVKVTNTNIPVMEAIARDFGAHVQRHRQRPNRRPIVDIHWATRSAVELLREIRPYLRIKAEISDVALAFAETIRKPDAKARAITAEEWKHREGLRFKIRTLNARFGSAVPEMVISPQLVRGAQTCQRCDQAFTANRKRKYCSPKCLQAQSKAWRLQRNRRECPQCGMTFEGNYHQTYCSHKCASAALWERRRIGSHEAC